MGTALQDPAAKARAAMEAQAADAAKAAGPSAGKDAAVFEGRFLPGKEHFDSDSLQRQEGVARKRKVRRFTRAYPAR